MSLFVSYLFVAAGIGILALASARVLKEKNALPELETLKNSLKKPLNAISRMNNPSRFRMSRLKMHDPVFVDEHKKNQPHN